MRHVVMIDRAPCAALRRYVLILAMALAAVFPTVACAQDPVADIASPQSGAIVRDVVVVTGTATHPSFSFYKVEFAPEPTENWSVIGQTQATQVQNGALVQWNTLAVPDGSYSLRLLVVDQTGNYLEETVRQVVVANASPVTATPEESPTPEETETPTVTPTAGTPEPTATVGVEIPALATATVGPTGTRISVTAAAVTPQATAVEDTSTVGLIQGMVGGILEEAIAAIGIDFGGLGSALVRGALLALAVFAVVGVLALLRAIMLGVYRLIRR